MGSVFPGKRYSLLVTISARMPFLAPISCMKSISRTFIETEQKQRALKSVEVFMLVKLLPGEGRVDLPSLGIQEEFTNVIRNPNSAKENCFVPCLFI